MFVRRLPHATTCHADIKPPLEVRGESMSLCTRVCRFVYEYAVPDLELDHQGSEAPPLLT